MISWKSPSEIDAPEIIVETARGIFRISGASVTLTRPSDVTDNSTASLIDRKGVEEDLVLTLSEIDESGSAGGDVNSRRR